MVNVYELSDGTSKKAMSSTEQQGLWDSVSTANGANGFGRIAGILTKTGWGLTVGSYYYVDASGNITTTLTNNPIGFAISATEMIMGI
jgi:hypothetical protein